MDYTRNTMRAAIKSLESVIAPAVETTDQAQAIEQVHLVTDFLKFAEQRIHLIADRERHQLLHAVHLAATLEPLVAEDEAHGTLHDARTAAEALLADPLHDCESVRRQSEALGAAIRRVTNAADSMDEGSRTAIERAILDASFKQATTDRAWLLPLGFDPDPGSLPGIENELVAAAPSETSPS